VTCDPLDACGATPHVVLVGMMGAGKSTVGRRVAKRLRRRFVDLDVEIERAASMTINEIFAAEGEAGFRAREHDVLVATLADDAPLVVATGGGAVVRADNRAAMASRGVVVWLRAAPATLFARIGQSTHRPLLADDARGNLERLHAERADAYGAVAQVIIDVDRLSFQAVTERVLRCAPGAPAEPLHAEVERG
jgi:shikimate kinase